MKSEKLRRVGIILLIFLGLGVVGNLVQYLAHLDDAPSTGEETAAVTEEPTEPLEWGEVLSFAPEAVQDLKIEWVAGSVTLRTGDVDQIQVQETEAKKKLDYTEHEDSLLLRYSRDSMSSLLGIHSKRGKQLIVTLPRDWEGRHLELQVAAADVTLAGIKAETVDFDGMSGFVKFEDCEVRQVSAQSVSGDIQFAGTVEEIACQGVSAKCSVRAENVPARITVEGVSGGLQVVLPAQAGFTLEAEGLSTGLNTDFEGTETDGKFVAGDGSCQIQLSGISADVQVSKAD